MRVLYYYYYLIYSRIIPDPRPAATAIFTLSFSLSLLINFLLQVLSITLFCMSFGKWAMISIFVLIFSACYIKYFRNGKYLMIIESEPKFFDSSRLSIIIIGFFFVLCVSSYSTRQKIKWLFLKLWLIGFVGKGEVPS